MVWYRFSISGADRIAIVTRRLKSRSIRMKVVTECNLCAAIKAVGYFQLVISIRSKYGANFVDYSLLQCRTPASKGKVAFSPTKASLKSNSIVSSGASCASQNKLNSAKSAVHWRVNVSQNFFSCNLRNCTNIL